MRGFTGFQTVLIIAFLVLASAGSFYLRKYFEVLIFSPKPPPSQTIIRNEDMVKITPKFLEPSTEEYCHQFNYDNCPVTCEIGPSNPSTTDIGCHAKGAHTLKNSN